jgi:putative transposase
MANTYTQINIHAIFSVKGRENIITNKFNEGLYKYITGILKNNGHFSLAVNGGKDHVHIFFELNPNQSIAELMRIVKTNSSKWINDRHFVNGHFNWQEGYGAFSYSRSQRNDVINYILNQEKHHQTRTFKEEYLKLLHDLEIEFDDHYVFEFYE